MSERVASGRGALRAWLARPGVSPRIALASQFASLGTTVLINLGLLLVGPDELVAFASVTAPCLLIIGVFDLGTNRRFMQDADVRQYLRIKCGVAVASVASVFVFSSRVATTSEQVAGAFYAVGFISMGTAIGFMWQRGMFRLEVMARISQGSGLVVGSAIGYASFQSITAVIAAQAIWSIVVAFLVGLAVRAVPATRERPAGGMEPHGGPGRIWAWVSPVLNGSAINLLSNGVFVIAALTTDDAETLAALRISALVGVGLYAVVPVGPQHFASMDSTIRHRYLRLIDLVGLAAAVALVLSQVLDLYDPWATSAALGAVWGMLVVRFTLVLNTQPVTTRMTPSLVVFLVGLVVFPATVATPLAGVTASWIGVALMTLGNVLLRRAVLRHPPG